MTAKEIIEQLEANRWEQIEQAAYAILRGNFDKIVADGYFFNELGEQVVLLPENCPQSMAELLKLRTKIDCSQEDLYRSECKRIIDDEIAHYQATTDQLLSNSTRNKVLQLWLEKVMYDHNFSELEKYLRGSVAS